MINTEKYLIIVESPNKTKTIEKYLGNNYKVIATKGHILQINGIKDVDIKNDFNVKYNIIENKKKHIEQIKNTIKDYTYKNIYIGTDADREGENIAWCICNLFNLPILKTKRILFREITKEAILDSINNFTYINMDLVASQRARQIIDILIGYKISPLLWFNIQDENNKKLLSSGRCQTPALRLIYENEIDQKNYIKNMNDNDKKYEIYAYFFDKNIKFRLNKILNNKEEILNFLNLSKNYNHTLKIENTEQIIEKPPSPLTTSKLLQYANNYYNMTPKETMLLCQNLYEEGRITYMRTDNNKYSNTFIINISKWINENYNNKYLHNNYEELINNNTNPHESIRITNINYVINDENKRKVLLYNFIRKHTIQSCMNESKINNTEIRILCPENNYYYYNNKTIIFDGWKILNKENENNDKLLYFETLKKDDIKFNEIYSILKIDKFPSNYTESSLINKLEKIGIGRPSTYSNIITTLFDRNYIKKGITKQYIYECNNYYLTYGKEIEIKKENIILGNEKNKLIIEELGIKCINFLLEYFNDIFNYEYTENMEKELDEIKYNVNDIPHKEISLKCLNIINNNKKKIKKIKKEKINEQYILNGIYLNDVVNNNSYIINNNDINNIKNGNTDIINDIINKNIIGNYNGYDIVIQNGKYGKYIKWNNENINIAKLKEINEINVIEYINNNIINKYENENIVRTTYQDKSIIKIINDDLSIRKGKYGNYIYYKNSDMKNPKFYSLKKLKKYMEMDNKDIYEWIKNTYNII